MSSDYESMRINRDAWTKRATEAEEAAYALIAENARLKAEVKALTLSGDAAGWEVVGYEEENERLTEALREIDTHIRATSDPIPHIVATLKRVLPEYVEESGDAFADEEVSADGNV